MRTWSSREYCMIFLVQNGFLETAALKPFTLLRKQLVAYWYLGKTLSISTLVTSKMTYVTSHQTLRAVRKSRKRNEPERVRHVYLLTMFRFARGVGRSRTVQHGPVFTFRPSRVNSETTDYSLRTTKEVLLRNTPKVSAFNLVKLQTGSHLNAGRPLSGILMDVELGVSLFVVHLPF